METRMNNAASAHVQAIGRYIGFSIWLTAVCSAMSAAATMGEQTFRFLFKAGTVVWIGEDIGGEYEQSVLYQATMTSDGLSVGASELAAFGAWEAIESLAGCFRTEAAVALQAQADGAWGHETVSWRLRAPDADAALMEAFMSHIHGGGRNGRSFYAASKQPVRHSPVVVGAAAERPVFSERGLFFNYRIAAAYYFPKSHLLLVFTHQPQKAVGLDTMHGFVLMRLGPEDR